MKSTRARKAAYQSIVATVLILTPLLPPEAQMNHTANYRGFGRFSCGSDWAENTLNCDLTAAPRSDNDLPDLVHEFARLTALSASEDEIEEADLTETGFFRLCEENPVRCLGWVADFARTGSLDGDIDGVLDGADACPDTSTAISQAQAILFSQEVALLEVEQVLRQVRERLIWAANGTLGDAVRKGSRSANPSSLSITSSFSSRTRKWGNAMSSAGEPQRSEIDPAGCNRLQFCSAITIASKKDIRRCVASDFLNGEPLRRSPRDCRVERPKGEKPRCVTTEAQK